MLVCKDTALLKSLLLDVTDVSCYNLSVTLHGLSVLLTTVVRMNTSRLSVTTNGLSVNISYISAAKRLKGREQTVACPRSSRFLGARTCGRVDTSETTTSSLMTSIDCVQRVKDD